MIQFSLDCEIYLTYRILFINFKMDIESMLPLTKYDWFEKLLILMINHFFQKKCSHGCSFYSVKRFLCYKTIWSYKISCISPSQNIRYNEFHKFQRFILGLEQRCKIILLEFLIRAQNFWCIHSTNAPEFQSNSKLESLWNFCFN